MKEKIRVVVLGFLLRVEKDTRIDVVVKISKNLEEDKGNFLIVTVIGIRSVGKKCSFIYKL